APAFTVVATKSRRVNAENMCILPARDAAGTGLSELPGGMKITGTPGKRGRKGRRSGPLDSRSRGRVLAVVEQLVHFFQGLRQQQPILLLLCRLEATVDHKADRSQEQVRHRDHQVNAVV